MNGDTENLELVVPEFKPNIPEELLKGLSKKDRYMYAQMSVGTQQNAWLIHRALKVDRRLILQEARDKAREEARAAAEKVKDAAQAAAQKLVDERLTSLEGLRTTLTAKWSVIALAAGSLLIPAGLVFLAEWVKARFFKP